MSTERLHPGIRLVRPLARDAHRESWLVRLDALETEESGPAVLVRALDEQGAQRVRAELAGLHRGQGEGVVPLLDVVDEPHGVALVRAHIVGPRLGAVLAERERWAAGEVVTVLRPIVDAVARLHRCGVAHGALGAAEFVLVDGGAVLVELGHAELFAPDAPEAVLVRTAGVGADREAIRTLAVELLRLAEGPRARAARALADEAEHHAGDRLLSMLRAGLDDLASPVPLRALDAEPAPPVVEGAERMLPVVRDATAGGDLEGEHARVQPPTLLARLAARGTVVAGTLRTRLDALPAMKRRALVAGGAALCAAAVLLALPGGGTGEATGTPARADAQQLAEASPVPTAAAEHPATGATDAAIRGDDPLAASVALLERRTQCFVELSLLCLEEVDQQGSAALSADRAAITALRAGEEAVYRDAQPVEPRLIERLGAGALVEVGPHTDPAPLLLMRSEAGWRIRDWVAVSGN